MLHRRSRRATRVNRLYNLQTLTAHLSNMRTRRSHSLFPHEAFHVRFRALCARADCADHAMHSPRGIFRAIYRICTRVIMYSRGTGRNTGIHNRKKVTYSTSTSIPMIFPIKMLLRPYGRAMTSLANKKKKKSFSRAASSRSLRPSSRVPHKRPCI